MHNLLMIRQAYEALRSYFADPASGSFATHLALIIALFAFFYQKSSLSWQSRMNLFSQQRDDFERYLSHAWINYVDLINGVSQAQFLFENRELQKYPLVEKNRLESYLADIRLARYRNDSIDTALENFSNVVRAARLELHNLDHMKDQSSTGHFKEGEIKDQFELVKSLPDQLNMAIEALEGVFAGELERTRPKTVRERLKSKIKDRHVS
jgi:hypothetical protein